MLISSTNSVSLVFVDLCTKKKLFIKCDDVKFLACPQYEGLAVHDILEEAGKDERVLKYLPDERDMHKVPRQWIVNIAYAIIGLPSQTGSRKQCPTGTWNSRRSRTSSSTSIPKSSKPSTTPLISAL